MLSSRDDRDEDTPGYATWDARPPRVAAAVTGVFLASLLVQIVARQPHRRSPAALANFRPLHVMRLREPYRLALVLYHPGMDRRQLAARLRYVFGSVIAPWSRSPDETARFARFCAYLARLGPPRVTMADVAARLSRRPRSSTGTTRHSGRRRWAVTCRPLRSSEARARVTRGWAYRR